MRIGQGRVGEGSVPGEKERKERGEWTENRELPNFGGFTRRAWRSSGLFSIKAAVICLSVGLSTLVESSERSLLKMDSAGPSISYTPAHGTKSGERVERVKTARMAMPCPRMQSQRLDRGRLRLRFVVGSSGAGHKMEDAIAWIEERRSVAMWL